jgi:DNA-binding LacI/PurR family transcriptional regulator
VRVARAEALATDTAPGSDHILLGIPRTDSDAARALRSEGMTLPTALDCVRSTNGSRAGGSDLSCIHRILRLAGFDDSPVAALSSPPLTTVRIDYAGFGEAAAALLLAEIGGTRRPEFEPAPPELIVRGSTAPRSR